WFAGANLYYVGERKDQLFLNDGVTVTSPFTMTLDSFFDANLHLGYHITDQFSVFAKGNNLGNQGYQRWQNFPVQSIQFLAGATYKFDFCHLCHPELVSGSHHNYLNSIEFSIS